MLGVLICFLFHAQKQHGEERFYLTYTCTLQPITGRLSELAPRGDHRVPYCLLTNRESADWLAIRLMLSYLSYTTKDKQGQYPQVSLQANLTATFSRRKFLPSSMMTMA